MRWSKALGGSFVPALEGILVELGSASARAEPNMTHSRSTASAEQICRNRHRTIKAAIVRQVADDRRVNRRYECGYAFAFAISSVTMPKVALIWVPSARAAAMMPTAMRAAMRPYSMAVANQAFYAASAAISGLTLTCS
jgi:hypothetical protein